jgi:hypothetical protein
VRGEDNEEVGGGGRMRMRYWRGERLGWRRMGVEKREGSDGDILEGTEIGDCLLRGNFEGRSLGEKLKVETRRS